MVTTSDAELVQCTNCRRTIEQGLHTFRWMPGYHTKEAK